MSEVNVSVWIFSANVLIGGSEIPFPTTVWDVFSPL